jgi:hypothetical protein
MTSFAAPKAGAAITARHSRSISNLFATMAFLLFVVG